MHDEPGFISRKCHKYFRRTFWKSIQRHETKVKRKLKITLQGVSNPKWYTPSPEPFRMESYVRIFTLVLGGASASCRTPTLSQQVFWIHSCRTVYVFISRIYVLLIWRRHRTVYRAYVLSIHFTSRGSLRNFDYWIYIKTCPATISWRLSSLVLFVRLITLSTKLSLRPWVVGPFHMRS
jgi:hypothetical protein